jgi:hypothetical protein
MPTLHSRVFRRALPALACAAAGLVGAAPARAVLLLYEPFDYAAETVLDGTPATGQNLAGSYAADAPAAFLRLEAKADGLDYGSLGNAPAVAGNQLTQMQGTSAAVARVAVDEDIAVGPGSALYWSALFTFDDSSNGNRLASITLSDDNGDALGFGEAAVGVRAIRVTAQTAATGGLVAAGADGAFANGQTLLLVGRYLNGAAAGGDRLDLIGYDTADADLLPASFDPSDPNREFAFALDDRDIDFGRITSIAFAIRGDDNNFIDELRIGSSYGSVIPEPGSGALLLLGLAGLRAAAAARRRSRCAA